MPLPVTLPTLGVIDRLAVPVTFQSNVHMPVVASEDESTVKLLITGAVEATGVTVTVIDCITFVVPLVAVSV